MPEKDYDQYLEDQLNELNYKHTTLSNNHVKLTKEHQLLLEQYDRLQEDLTNLKLNKNMPKSKSLGNLEEKTSEYFSSGDISPILNIENVLTKLERSKFKPIQNFDKDYEFCQEMLRKIKRDLMEDENGLHTELLLVLLETQGESNLYHYKYAKMIQDKDEAFRNNYYNLPEKFNNMKIMTPPTISSGHSSVSTIKASFYRAVKTLGNSVQDLVALSQERLDGSSK